MSGFRGSVLLLLRLGRRRPLAQPERAAAEFARLSEAGWAEKICSWFHATPGLQPKNNMFLRKQCSSARSGACGAKCTGSKSGGHQNVKKLHPDCKSDLNIDTLLADRISLFHLFQYQ